jgi:hypothetical protein
MRSIWIGTDPLSQSYKLLVLENQPVDSGQAILKHQRQAGEERKWSAGLPMMSNRKT